MPANLPPEYKAAEAAFRKARDPRERLEWLREMLRTIPKHKGTDHLQGDIKRRIKELSEELERPQRGGARGGPALIIRPEGAAQIALIGPPNAGKSSQHARLQHPPATFLAGLPAAGAGSPSPRHLGQRNSTLAGCDVDSHSAWYKTSVRSSQSLLMTLSRRVQQAEENTERREAHWLGYDARAAPHVRTGARKAVDVWLGT